MYKFNRKIGLEYPSEAFSDFECIMTGELATIVAESNSGKTTFALDMITKNAEKGVKGYYINLEFPIETMWQSRRLWFNNKTKKDLTSLGALTDEQIEDLERYVNENLNKIEYYNNSNGIDLDMLLKVIEIQSLAGFKFFVIDTFSKIHGNATNDARGHQNKTMEELQELAQRLNVAIIVLHHTNRQGTWEGSQKIMDLSNVFIVISKEMDAEGEEYRHYALMKDKYVVNKEVDVYYYGGKYVKDGLPIKSRGDYVKPF